MQFNGQSWPKKAWRLIACAGLLFVFIGTGAYTMTMDFSAVGLNEDWLQYDRDGDTNHNNNPEANITFGIYSRSKKIIYSREPW